MTVGEALAEARYRAGLTVDDVSERTRIREAVIRCIEQDDYEACGGDLYVRGYVRAIAGAVGIDAQPLIHEFDAARAAVPGAAIPGAAAPGAATPGAPAPGAARPNGTPAAAPTVVQPAVPAVAPTLVQPAVPADATVVQPAVPADATVVQPGPPPEAGTDAATAPPDPAETRFDLPPIPAADPGFTLGDLGFTSADPGFAPAFDPGFTTAEWQYTVADHDRALADFDRAVEERNGKAPAPWVDPWADVVKLPPPAPASARPAAREASAPSSAWRSRIRGRRWVTGIVILLAIVLAVAGVAGSHIITSLRHTPAVSAANTAAAGSGAGHTGHKSKAKPAPSASPSPSPVTAPPPLPVVTLPIALAQAYGPQGTSDGDNPQIESGAITPGASSPWQTNWYATANFGRLEQGTGLLLDMGKRDTITSVRAVLSPYIGANVQLWAGNTPVFADMRVVSSLYGVGGTVRMRLAAPVRARYLLIWFTLLPPDGAGTYREDVYSVAVKGHR